MRNKLLFILLFISFFVIGCDENQIELEEPNIPNVEAESQDNNLQEEDVSDVSAENTSNEDNKTENIQLEQLKVHYIDVGQGDASLLQFSYNYNNYRIFYNTIDGQ